MTSQLAREIDRALAIATPEERTAILEAIARMLDAETQTLIRQINALAPEPDEDDIDTEIAEPLAAPDVGDGLSIWIDRRGFWQLTLPHATRPILLTKNSHLRIPSDGTRVMVIYEPHRALDLAACRRWLNEAGFAEVVEVPHLSTRQGATHVQGANRVSD